MSDIAEDKKGSALDPLARESIEWIVGLTSGAVTEADARALERWRSASPAHAAALNDALRLSQALRIAAGEFVREHGVAGDREIATPRMGRRALLGGLVAASAAGLFFAGGDIGLWPSLAELSADYRTATGERRNIALAAGLLVELNTQTSLAVRSASVGPRVELIEGEAAFTAKLPPSSPFTVVALDASTVATDASFDVRRDGDGVCVNCMAGQVEIVQGSSHVRLRAGQQLSYTESTLGAAIGADPDTATAWRRGLLVFRNRPLSEMLAEVNRYRPGRIVLANARLGRQTFNGIFRLDHIDSVLAQLEKLGARVTSLPGGIVLVT